MRLRYSNKKKNNYDITKNPLEFLDDELDIHDYYKCKKEQNHNCSICNHRADEVYADFKKETYHYGGNRMKKIYVETMKHIFGTKITKRARDRYNSNEHYKKLHTNQIPCSCETKTHNQCDGFKTNSTTF